MVPQHSTTVVSDAQRLFESSYAELRRLAQHLMACEPSESTLQATALVNEAYLRFADSAELQCADRRHFIHAVTKAMRHALIDHARTRGARKRGGDWHRVHLEDIGRGSADSFPVSRVDDLDRVLQRLDGHNPRCAEVLRLRFFAGLTVGQTATVMDISETTVKNDWKYARAWLLDALDRAP